MALNRRTLLAAAGAAALTGALAACNRDASKAGANAPPITPATLERAQGPGATFIPVGEYRTRATDLGYVEEEWFASGTDDSGQPYKTQVFVRRPNDPAKFSGIVFIEPMHATSAAPIYMYCSPYILRSGHGWACVASQKTPLDNNVKPANAERYASLHIEASAGSAPPQAQAGSTPEQIAARREAAARFNQASNAILAQASAALRASSGPFGAVKQLIMVGHSQTGGVVTNYILNAHDTHRLDGGAPIINGFFPSGAARDAFGPRDAPLVQLLAEGDIDDAQSSNGRAYRREDSDDEGDRYRLYELAGASHMGTRYAPHSDPTHWTRATEGAVGAGDRMNSYPHHEMFSMALNHLVTWLADGTAPPRAERLETAADGRFFAKDENGNSLGGVRCAQLDVPHITYHPDPLDAQGHNVQAVVGTETPLPAARLRQLYQTPANYAQRFDARLNELIGQGWFLNEDAADMRREAAAVRF